MKNVLLMICFVMPCLLLSCSKEEKEEPITTTYTFQYNADNVTNLIVDVTLFECNDIDETIGTNSIDNCGLMVKIGDEKDVVSLNGHFW